MSETILGTVNTEAALSASVGAEAQLQASVAQGPVIINDYVIDLQEVPEGVQLTVRKGSEEQTALIPMGASGGASHWDELEGKPTGTEGQIVGFDAEGNMVAQNGVATDDTLAVSGAAADAKVVGDRFTEVNGSMESVAMAAGLAMPGSLKWDGVIGDKTYVSMGEVDGMLMAMVHITDEVPTVLEPTGFASMSSIMGAGGALPITLQEVSGAYVGEVVFIIPSDNFTIEELGLTFPKKGVYFMVQSALPQGMDISLMYVSAFKLMGYSFAESGGGGSEYFVTTEGVVSENVGDTLTWDGEFGNLLTVSSNVEYNGVTIEDGYVLVSDTVLSAEEIASATGFVKKVTRTNGSLQETQISGLYIQPTEGVEGLYDIRCDYVDDNGNARDQGFAYMANRDGIAAPYYGTLPKAGIYYKFMYSSTGDLERVGSLTINGCNFNQFSNKTATVIKHEHLPAALQFGEMDIPSDTLTWDGDVTGITDIIDGALFRVSDAVPTIEDMARGGSITVTTPEGPGSEEIEGFATGIAGVYVYSRFVYIFTQTVEGLPAGVYLYKADDAYVSSLTLNGYTGFATKEFKTIDPKYLPSGAGGSGLPEVSASDAGKILRVSATGEWVAEAIPNAEEASF